MTRRFVKWKEMIPNVNDIIETKDGEIVEIPPYIKIIDKNTVKVKTWDFRGSHVSTIKRMDFFKHEHGSGFAMIGSIGGDWRQIMYLTEEIKFVFDRLSECDLE